MHSKKITDAGKPQKRYHRSVGPNVTINNIVTLDPKKYARASSTSKLSQDTDYDRVKFLVEERARYWRDLKVLYNDYTLVKLKQTELLDSEDNYVNQHCIEETVKLSSALKLKIQAKCKDIIFITNLCGNSEVNRVVQNLADGEDIDSVLIKKQNSITETKQAEEVAKQQKCTTTESKGRVIKKKVVKSVNKVEKKEKDDSVPSLPAVPPKRKSSVNEPKFYDSELHWCQYCNVFPPTIKKYLQHLHDESHKKKIKELKINESPWHKCLPEEQAWRTDSTDSVRVKAFNFFVPANGWFCQLCRSWMGDIHCAATHLRSYVHNMNLKNFQEKFPNWKQGWLDERSKALEKTFEGRKESSVDNAQEQHSKKSKKKEDLESSSDEEDPAEPISRHRTAKAKMWVPNPKAFERVCNETNPNPTPSFSESSHSKINKLQKKDRPPFIGKMPLISTINKKIVMKELPQNTTENIATSCAESDKLQREQDELKELIIRRNEEESEIKLKEFMRVAEKIKKGSRKRKRQLDIAIAAESYNAMDYTPVVEPVDPIDNLINPPALVAQWEADANYAYHMRQLQHYNMAAQMMTMPQPQTFLLDPYHAIALHNQQYYNSTHNMISNQYENFEIISRDDEQVYSQYIDFQNSPSSSPSKKMFSTGKSESIKSDFKHSSAGDKDKRHKDTKKRDLSTETPDKLDLKRSSIQEETQGKEKRPLKDKLRSQSSLKPKKSKTSHIIQKAACLNASSSNDVMPTFKETFLSNSDNVIPSSGYISTLLSSYADVKIVSANEVYKKKAPSKRRRIKKKLKHLKANETELSNVESSEHVTEDQQSKVDLAGNTKEIGDNLLNIPNEGNNEESAPHSSGSKQTPKKNPGASLQDKINSIRKAIDRNKLLDTLEEDVPTKKLISDDKDSRTSGHMGFRSSRRGDEYSNRHEEEYDDSEDDGDTEKLIYYDMTSI